MQLQTLGIGMPTRPNNNLPSQLGNRQQQQQLVQSDGAIITTSDGSPNNGLGATPGLPQLTSGAAQHNFGAPTGVGLVPPSSQHSYGLGSTRQQQQQQQQQPFGGGSGQGLSRPNFLNQAICL